MRRKLERVVEILFAEFEDALAGRNAPYGFGKSRMARSASAGRLAAVGARVLTGERE